MTLRVVLVGAVASLGLALPSGERLESWTHSGRTWLNTRLAEWGSHDPIDDNAFVVVAAPVEFVADAEVPAKIDEAVAQNHDPAPAEETAAETPDPSPVPVEEDLDLEAALDEWTETLATKAPVVAAAPRKKRLCPPG